ncbi:hypothetical protein FE257_011794 [Aspergillus nanangensis]|uniref:Carboxylic ester hydrolase n=1 Tax=Aspergillus nanangensis TaxID=2582783 RepID=A0AAD4CVS6_ASPNN|nr:hypothetical protein FE257_011794 [Aspergillus nanangensis]
MFLFIVYSLLWSLLGDPLARSQTVDDGIHILSVTGVEVHNYPSPFLSLIAPTNTTTIDFRNCTVTLTHPGIDDIVIVSLWLPPPDLWNSKFLSTGGSGLQAGIFGLYQPSGVALGYATASTEGGLSKNNTLDPSTGAWAVNSDGSLNETLITNYEYRSVHDMAVVGKQIVRQYYGAAARYSYFFGCSTGGGQGYQSAARYPRDFDGIMANSPALDPVTLGPLGLWPMVVMGSESVVVPQCVFEVYQQEIVRVCDPLDGVREGLITSYWPRKCVDFFDPGELVGRVLDCEDTNGRLVINETHAEVVRRVLRGPTRDGQHQDQDQVGYGIPPGASFAGMANTVVVNGTVAEVPFGPFSPYEGWGKYLVLRNGSSSVLNMTEAEFWRVLELSRANLSGLFALSPDLSGFRNAGGKLLSWHGMADRYVPYVSTRDYFRKVAGEAAGNVDDFYRLFLAPGADHCFLPIPGLVPGPIPVSPWAALIQWVEKGIIPETLSASTVTGHRITRELCPYPWELRYKGQDNVDEASSWTCQKA